MNWGESQEPQKDSGRASLPEHRGSPERGRGKGILAALRTPSNQPRPLLVCVSLSAVTRERVGLNVTNVAFILISNLGTAHWQNLQAVCGQDQWLDND